MLVETRGQGSSVSMSTQPPSISVTVRATPIAASMPVVITSSLLPKVGLSKITRWDSDVSIELSTTCQIHSCSVTVMIASTGSKSMSASDAFFVRRTSSSSFFFPLLGVVRTLLPPFLSILLLPLFVCTHPILRPRPQSEVTFHTLNRSPRRRMFEWNLEGSLKLQSLTNPLSIAWSPTHKSRYSRRIAWMVTISGYLNAKK